MTILGQATAEGTGRFAGRFGSPTLPHFRLAQGLTLSSLGLGTYGGDDSDVVDDKYAAAIEQAIEAGCNVIDTAPAYRHQRSERMVGRTLSKLIDAGKIRRDEVVISTKAGFLPFDSTYSGGVQQYYDETFFGPGIVVPDDVVAPGHCMAPSFLRHQIETSLCNLNCSTIDIYYLHNPETQLRELSRDLFRTRILAVFEELERAVTEGKIGMYGVSTWNGFRTAPDEKSHLELAELLRWAKEVAGHDHHFGAIIVPLNLSLLEAFAYFNQEAECEGPESARSSKSVLQAAAALGIIVMAGSSLHLGRLAHDLPVEVRSLFNGELTTDAQRALQFTRSTPGVTTALVGMAEPGHVRENLKLVTIPPISEDRFLEFFY